MNRDQYGEIARQLEHMRGKLLDVEHIASENRNELRRVLPQQTIQPVPRPRQGTNMSRGTNVTKYMRQYTKEKNSTIGDSSARYTEFSEEIDDKQYNTDAMNCLEWILGLHLGSELGVLSWDQVCKRDPRKMGLIIKDSINAPELAVFSQAAGQWAIQMLIANKMNSRLRYNRDHSQPDAHEVELPELAPTTVPDMNGLNHALPVGGELTRGGLPNVGSSNFHRVIASQQQPHGTTRNNGLQNVRDQRTPTVRGRGVSRGRITRTRRTSRSVSIRSRSSSRTRGAGNRQP